MPSPPDSLTTLLTRLAASGVDFLLVGGLAAVAQGAPLTTQDVDIVQLRTPANVDVLLAFLASVNARYRGRPGPAMPPSRDALLGAGRNLFMTDLGPLDVLGAIEGGRGYEELLPGAVELDVGGQRVRVLHLATLAELKRGATTAKDKLTLAILDETLRRVRGIGAGERIELTARDGHRLAGYRAAPRVTPRGGLVVVQEIFGVNAHIREVVDGFAADGYLVVAPALFDRIERGVELGYRSEDVLRGRELKSRASLDCAMDDVSAAVAAAAVAGKVGIVGYCWGGLVCWAAAASVPGLACAVAYYGGGILERAEELLACPALCHFGARDAMIPLAGVEAFAAAHPAYTVHVYPADHGFNCDHRGSYDAASAELARERTLAFLRQHVG